MPTGFPLPFFIIRSSRPVEWADILWKQSYGHLLNKTAFLPELEYLTISSSECMLGSFRLCLDHFVSAWVISSLLRSFRLCLDHFVSAWIISSLLGSFRLCLDHFVSAWIISSLLGSDHWSLCTPPNRLHYGFWWSVCLSVRRSEL